jgi:excisionase family DNA binding protein
MEIENIRDCKLYTIKELTEILGCHENTLYLDIKSGKLKALQTKDKAKYRVIGKFVKEYLGIK